MTLLNCSVWPVPVQGGNAETVLRPEKVLSKCFRTGVRLPSAPPYEKSELIPHRECVRIFHFYQGYFLLMFIPGGFFILRVFLLFAHSIPDRSPATMIAENH